MIKYLNLPIDKKEREGKIIEKKWKWGSVKIRQQMTGSLSICKHTHTHILTTRTKRCTHNLWRCECSIYEESPACPRWTLQKCAIDDECGGRTHRTTKWVVSVLCADYCEGNSEEIENVNLCRASVCVYVWCVYMFVCGCVCVLLIWDLDSEQN